MVRNRYFIEGVGRDSIRSETENNKDPEVLSLKLQHRIVKKQGKKAINKSLQRVRVVFSPDGLTGVATHSRTFLGEA